MDQGKDPWEYAESGFDFQVSSEQEEEELDLDKTQQSNEEMSSDDNGGDESDFSNRTCPIDEDTEEMAEDAPEPDEDDEEDNSSETSGSSRKGAFGCEWKTIDEAVENYKSDDDGKFLLCVRSMSAFTSPMMAQKHAEEDEGEVWAAAEKIPDEFKA